MISPRLIAIVGTVLTAGGLAAACGSSQSPAADDRAPVYALAAAAAVDADNMDAHASAMEQAAKSSLARNGWTDDAGRIRTEATSLRFITSSALAIARDPGSSPGGAVELRRVLGDGLNLHQLGTALLQHADEMQAHLQTMRSGSAGDQALLSLIDRASEDVVRMRRDGDAAVERGRALEQEAERIALNTGQTLPGP